MLITPVQPYNSLNNVVTLKQRHSEDSPPTRSSKIQPIKPVRKPSTLRTRKLPSQGDGGPKNLTDQENEGTNAAKQSQEAEGPKRDHNKGKQVPADVLKEYQQINRDKEILTAEIKNMRLYLSDIRSKLDQSLTVLNKNTTLFAMKNGLAPPKSGKAKRSGQKKSKKKTKKAATERESFFTKEFLQMVQ